MIRTWSQGLISVFASPIGVLLLAALDSTLFVSLPFGLDAAIIVLAARMGALAWVVVLLATAGSLAGAAVTFWMGIKIGENGLERHVTPRRLARIRARIKTSGAIAIAALDLIPPPFPFTPFILAAGALEVDRSTFFITLTMCRLVRFGVEAALAVVYGQHIIAWLDSEIFQTIVFGCAAIAVILTILSIVHLIRATRPQNTP